MCSSLVTAHASIATSPMDIGFTFRSCSGVSPGSRGRVQPGLQCPWTMQCSCWRELGRVPLRPGHIPSWNSSISLPGMKVNTPAKSFLDKTYLPRARGSTCPCQRPGMQTGGGSRVCDMAVTGVQLLPPPPSSSPGINSLWNLVHSFSLVCLSLHCFCCLRCYILWLENANSSTNRPEFHFSLPFGKQFSIHKEFSMKGSVLEHWHHCATYKTGFSITRWPRVLAAVQNWGAGTVLLQLPVLPVHRPPEPTCRSPEPFLISRWKNCLPANQKAEPGINEEQDPGNNLT